MMVMMAVVVIVLVVVVVVVFVVLVMVKVMMVVVVVVMAKGMFVHTCRLSTFNEPIFKSVLADIVVMAFLSRINVCKFGRDVGISRSLLSRASIVIISSGLPGNGLNSVRPCFAIFTVTVVAVDGSSVRQDH